MYSRRGDIERRKIKEAALPGELTTGTFRSIASLYASGCLLAATLTISDGNNFLFSYMHLAFIAASACLLMARGFINGIWQPLSRNWSHVFLVMFLGYFLAMALLHPDAEVARRYTHGFFNTLVPGLLMGYVAFAAYGSRRTRTYDTRSRWRPGVWRALFDLMAFSAFCTTIAVSYWLFLPLIRQDLFLLNVPNEQRIYQMFGNYLVLALILFLHVISPYFQFRYHESIAASGLWATAAAGATGACFFLAQMAGSNAAAAMVVGIGAVFYGYRIVTEFRDGTRCARRRSYAVLLVAVISTISLWQLLGQLPPLRIFNFQEVAAPSD